jgi:hypothetical protein
MENLRYRMYGLVPYNISDIQKGIQFGHAVVEYAKFFGNTDEYKSWVNHDKTFIILDGGTTNKKTSIENGMPYGTLNQHLLALEEQRKMIGYFEEPDLGDQLTAIVFLVDERVWDYEKYPEYECDVEPLMHDSFSDIANHHDDYKKIFFPENEVNDEIFSHIMWMRNFLKQFKLA